MCGVLPAKGAHPQVCGVLPAKGDGQATEGGAGPAFPSTWAAFCSDSADAPAPGLCGIICRHPAPPL